MVAVCTYKRPKMLYDLLSALAEQAQPGMSTVVVDNDRVRSAMDVAKRFSGVTYSVEPERGIASARNRAVSVALATNPRAIAFIDDDEVPSPGWLEALASALTPGVDVAAGPVIYDVSMHSPEKISTDQYIRTRTFGDGEVLTYVGTGNVIVRADWFRAHRFDTAFNLTGGEDLEFFLRLQDLGARCVWSAHASVVTRVPAERITRKWNLMRELRNSQLIGRLDMMRHGSSRTDLIRDGLKSILRAVQVNEAEHGRATSVRMRRALLTFSAIGSFRAALGWHYEEYR